MGAFRLQKEKNVQYSKVSKSRWLEYAASYLIQALADSHVLALNLRAMAGNGKQEFEAEQWSRSANGASENRCFARSRKGYYVLGPGIMAPGDIVCVLFGGKLPFCLRPCGRRYLLVGECYVHGLMEGEAMQLVDRGELSEKVFDIV
ncbi:hypothetical protein GGR51DRAFT_505248 [Nemania sp. FL0031]|nr:hypothetical protein GGR51DRAFT_505248 [Nemania sp. FL0031]